MRKLVLLCVLGAAVVGCGKKRISPGADQTVDLAGKQATWHEWKLTNICEVDERRVEQDLSSMKELLLSALGQTSASFDGAWSDEHLAILEKMPKALPDALDSVERGVADAASCKWSEQSKVPSLLGPLGELLAQARRKVETAPALLAKVKAYQALKSWKEKQPEAKESAKKDWCPPKPKAGMPDIYYAFEDETGRSEWLFCDDAKVVMSGPGAPPAFEPPAAAKKKPKDKPYLDAAAKYPASDVQRAPRNEEAPKKAAEAEPAN